MAASRYTPTGEKYLGLWFNEWYSSSTRFVYVVQGDPGTPIKVGVANNPIQRMKGIQTGYPWRLRLLFVVPGDQHLEWYLHERLKGHRLLGEWFEPVDAFLDYVADLADRMMDAWDGHRDNLPDYADQPEIRDALPANRQRHTVTVRHVEPDPVMSPDQIRQLEKLRVQYGSTSVQVSDFQRACLSSQ